MPPEVGNMPVAMEPLSRRVYVGLGQYGALVADEIRLQLQREPSGLNQRTVVLDFQAGRPPLGPSDGLSRRAVREQFMAQGAFGQVFERIDEAVNFCARMLDASEDLAEPDPVIHVLLIADLADPLAGGLLFDMARLARIAVSGRRGSIIGILTLGLFLSGQEGKTYVHRREGQGNVCAALRELDYVMAKGLEDFRYSDPVPAARDGSAFDQCFLLTEANSHGSLASIAEHACFLRRLLFRLGRGDFLRQLTGFPDQVCNPGLAPQRPLYSSAGMSSVYLAVRDIHTYCMERWAADVTATLQIAAPEQAPAAVAAHEMMRSVLPPSAESLVDAVGQRAAPLPEPTFAAGFDMTRRKAAQLLLADIEAMERAAQATELPAKLQEVMVSRYVVPFQAKCRSQVNKLVETDLAGIGLANALLNRLYAADFDAHTQDLVPEFIDLSRQLRRMVETAHVKATERMDRCRQGLAQVLATEDDTPLPPRPSWLFHPVRYWRVVRQQRALQDWIDAWLEEMQAVRDALRARQTAAYAQHVLAMLSGVVQVERKAIQALVELLHAAAEAIGAKHRAGVPQPLGVDRAIIPKTCYETIYAECIRMAGMVDIQDALTRLVVHDRFLADFRRATAERLASAMEAAGCSFFNRVLAMNMDSVLSDPRYNRYIAAPHDLLAALWERGDPLIDISGALLPAGWDTAELSALWLPGPESSLLYGPALVALGYHPQVTTGSHTSVHLCRVIHGFTLDMVAALGVYLSSYNSHQDKKNLHLFDWIDRLSPLPEAE